MPIANEARIYALQMKICNRLDRVKHLTANKTEEDFDLMMELIELGNLAKQVRNLEDAIKQK
jgi:hypothetical protein